MRTVRLPPPLLAAPRPVYSTLYSTATVSQPPSNPAGFIQLPPTPPPLPLEVPPPAADAEIIVETDSGGQPQAPPANTAAENTPWSRSLRDAIPTRPKPKQFVFEYADRDFFEVEINDFYNYQDKLFIQEGRDLFEASFSQSWMASTIEEKTAYLVTLLEGLEMANAEARYIAAKKLLYIAQGVFGELSSVQDHVESIRANCRLLFEMGAFSYAHQALRIVSKTLDDLTKAPSATSSRKDSSADRQAAIDLANAETSVYLSLCYMLIEANFDNAKLPEEVAAGAASLGSCNSSKPIAVELFELIAQLAEGHRKHYPVKKVSAHVKRTLAQTVPVAQPFKSKDGVLLPEPLKEADAVLRRNLYISHGTLQIARAKKDFEVWEGEVFGGAFPSAQRQAHPLSDSSGARYSKSDRSSKLDEGKQGLERVEALYRFLAPNMSTHVGMLVRLLYYVNLGNTTGGQDGEGQGAGTGASGSDSLLYPELPSDAVLTKEQRREYLERVDVIKHKEIVTKAVSAIILILLKATKTDHVLKFEYISQLLVDNNCAILILKMHSLWFQNQNANAVSGETGATQGIGSWLVDRVDPFELNFFHFCRNPTVLDTSLNGAAMEEDEKERDDTKSSDQGNQETGEVAKVTSDDKHASPPPAELSATNVDSPGQIRGSWRNFFTAINLLRILQKITKRKIHRILALVQWKASAVLKRVLKIQHVGLQLYALKLLKSQIPYLGRKWRGSNMKVITAIFMHLRPNAREEYLSGDFEIDVEDAMAQEQSLRNLIAFYHHRVLPDAFAYPTTGEGAAVNGRLAAHAAEQKAQILLQRRQSEEERLQPSTSKSARSDHDELEAILTIVRRGTEAHTVSLLDSDGYSDTFPAIGSNDLEVKDDPVVDPVTAAHAANAVMPTLGRNYYRNRVVEDDGYGLDENFMQNYEQWLHQEVFSNHPLWDLDAESLDGKSHPMAGDSPNVSPSSQDYQDEAAELDRGRTKKRASAGLEEERSQNEIGVDEKSHRPSPLQIPGKLHQRSNSHQHRHRANEDIPDRRSSAPSTSPHYPSHDHASSLDRPGRSSILDSPSSPYVSPLRGSDSTSDVPYSLRSPERELLASLDRSTVPNPEDDFFDTRSHSPRPSGGANLLSRFSAAASSPLSTSPTSPTAIRLGGADAMASSRSPIEQEEISREPIETLHAPKGSPGWGVTMGPWLDGEDEFLDRWGMPLGGADAYSADGSGALIGTTSGVPIGSVGGISSQGGSAVPGRGGATSPSLGLLRAASPNPSSSPVSIPGSSGSRSPYIPRHGSGSSLSPLRSVMAEDEDQPLLLERRDRSSSKGRNRRQHRKESSGSAGSLVHSPRGSAGQLHGIREPPSPSLVPKSLEASMPPPSPPLTASPLGPFSHTPFSENYYLNDRPRSRSNGSFKGGSTFEAEQSSNSNPNERVVPDHSRILNEDVTTVPGEDPGPGSGIVAPVPTPLSSAPGSPQK
ncbi:Factor arrest protein 11 [Phlyctochytrium bullatum]|nr:Factor arrest protein 11 [Phlyctochytrium bullatum]